MYFFKFSPVTIPPPLAAFAKHRCYHHHKNFKGHDMKGKMNKQPNFAACVMRCMRLKGKYNILQTPHKHYPNATQMPRKCHANATQMPRKCHANNKPIQRKTPRHVIVFICTFAIDNTLLTFDLFLSECLENLCHFLTTFYHARHDRIWQNLMKDYRLNLTLLRSANNLCAT